MKRDIVNGGWVWALVEDEIVKRDCVGCQRTHELGITISFANSFLSQGRMFLSMMFGVVV